MMDALAKISVYSRYLMKLQCKCGCKLMPQATVKACGF
jgi:hypothetical protein